jgi:hypothetical protein
MMDRPEPPTRGLQDRTARIAAAREHGEGKKPMTKFRIIFEHRRFYVEYRRWFWWRRLMSLEGWWSAPSLEAACAKVNDLKEDEADGW